MRLPIIFFQEHGRVAACTGTPEIEKMVREMMNMGETMQGGLSTELIGNYTVIYITRTVGLSVNGS